jgi:hypothetical protein
MLSVATPSAPDLAAWVEAAHERLRGLDCLREGVQRGLFDLAKLGETPDAQLAALSTIISTETARLAQLEGSPQ